MQRWSRRAGDSLIIIGALSTRPQKVCVDHGVVRGLMAVVEEDMVIHRFESCTEEEGRSSAELESSDKPTRLKAVGMRQRITWGYRIGTSCGRRSATGLLGAGSYGTALKVYSRNCRYSSPLRNCCLFLFFIFLFIYLFNRTCHSRLHRHHCHVHCAITAPQTAPRTAPSMHQ